jgi:RNA polymerase sigma-70 factor, ECF subfamily
MLRAHLDGDPTRDAPFIHDFLGQRCDEVVASVLSQLRARGVIRDH